MTFNFMTFGEMTFGEMTISPPTLLYQLHVSEGQDLELKT